jgi:hypothetical protein
MRCDMYGKGKMKNMPKKASKKPSKAKKIKKGM